MNKFYPIGDTPSVEEMKSLELPHDINSMIGHRNVAAINTNVVRCPMKGEWYLSGAEPMAYKAPNNLSTKFYIARLVRVKKVVNWTQY